MTNFIDNPETDGTDAAHPAWWRGNDAGALTVTRRLRKALDGQDDGSGVIGNPEIEQLRRDVMKMRRERDESLARERQLREALKRIAEDVGFGHDNLCDIAEASLSTPAPRVFTVEDVRPLVEALHEAIESSIAHISGSIQSGSPLDRWIKTLTHARKLGMEGGR